METQQLKTQQLFEKPTIIPASDPNGRFAARKGFLVRVNLAPAKEKGLLPHIIYVCYVVFVFLCSCLCMMFPQWKLNELYSLK